MKQENFTYEFGLGKSLKPAIMEIISRTALQYLIHTVKNRKLLYNYNIYLKIAPK